MSTNPAGANVREQALIESDTKLLHAIPPAGSLHPPKTRPPLPHMLDDLRLARAIRFLENNLANTVQLKDVATHVGLSPFYFQRYFKDAMGETPASYVRRVKLDQAAISLLNNDMHVVELAFATGYASHEAFVRAFHRQFGLVPTQYRVHGKRTASQPQTEDLLRAETVRVHPLPSESLLAMRFYGPYASVEDHWQKFASMIRQIGLSLDGLQAVGIAHDSPEITPNE